VVENYGCGKLMGRAVDGVGKSHLRFPLLYRNDWLISGFRHFSKKLILKKNVFPKFQDTKHKITGLPSLSGQKGGAKSTPSELASFQLS
jgi:hypothetical protein